MNLYDVIRAIIDGSGHLLNDARWRAHAHAVIDGAEGEYPLASVASPLPPEVPASVANVTPDLQAVIGKIIAEQLAKLSAPVQDAVPEPAAPVQETPDLAAVLAELAAVRAQNDQLAAQVAQQQGEGPA